MEKNSNGLNLQNGVPMYIPALLLGSIPILIAGKFIPQTMSPREQTDTAPEGGTDIPMFMPGGGGFPFPESM